MKHLVTVFSLVLLIVLANSCKKESVNSASLKLVDNSPSIAGTWELRQMVAQVGTINYPAGNGSTIEFDESNYMTTDTTYKIFVQGNHPKRGHYLIVADTSVNTSTGLALSSGQFANRIILNNDTTSDKVFYQITNNQLIILSGYFPTDYAVKIIYEKE